MITEIQCIDKGIRRDHEIVRDVWVGGIVSGESMVRCANVLQSVGCTVAGTEI